jgi:hypothetical protein
LITVHGCLNLIRDSNNKIYKIPNFCINDPYFEKNINQHANEGDSEINIDVRLIKKQIYLYDLYENKKSKHTVSNHMTGEDLKKFFLESSGINPEEYRIKLLFGGSEIKDEHYLYQHGLKNDYTVQISKVKIDNN